MADNNHVIDLAQENEIEAREYDGAYALHRAATRKGGNVLEVERLLRAGADVNERLEGSGVTPLFEAVMLHARLPVIQALIDHGADPTIKAGIVDPPIDIFTYLGSDEFGGEELYPEKLELIKILSKNLTEKQLIEYIPAMGLTHDQIKELLSHRANERRGHALRAWAQAPRHENNAAGGHGGGSRHRLRRRRFSKKRKSTRRRR